MNLAFLTVVIANTATFWDFKQYSLMDIYLESINRKVINTTLHGRPRLRILVQKTRLKMRLFKGLYSPLK